MPFYAKKRGVDLTFFAKCYESYGWSVIPLLGSLDLSRSKHPAIKWGRYQHIRSQQSDFDDWFLKQGFGGLGIVCGRVSNLVVLDFDDAQKVSEFRHQYPHLTETRIIESGTRCLPHYYYHVPDGLEVYSRSVPGVDLRADGTYVVAPPTRVGDAEWRVIQDQLPRTLSKTDLKAILRFLAATTPQTQENGSKAPSRLISRHLGGDFQVHKLLGSNENRRNSDTSGFDLVALYRERLSMGRNNALFGVACMARDVGWTPAGVSRALLNIHALQPDAGGQCELFQTRYAEAQRTIRSAFSRPPRRQVSAFKDTLLQHQSGVGIPTPASSQLRTGLSNAIRETLLGQGFVVAARVLDGLYLAGLKVDTTFTERHACEMLQQYRIGRRSITAALKTVLADGACLFGHVASPLHTTPTQANAATGTQTEEKKCGLSQVANRVKTSGRPPTNYVLPNNGDLSERLGLVSVLASGDQLGADDLASPTTYRRALHRELIKRRPGQYPRIWLAARLGISAWTCRRYETEVKMIVQPMYVEERICWTNVENLLPLTLADARPGTFLEDAEGKRYPPLRSIAARLMDDGRQVTYKRRVANYYACATQEGVGIPTPSVAPQSTETRANSQQAPIKLVQAGSFVMEDSCSQSRLPNPKKALPSATHHPISPAIHAEGVGIPTPSYSDPKTEPSFWFCPACLKTHIGTAPPTDCNRCGATDWECVADTIWQDQELLKTWWQTRWREKHPAAPRRATPLANPRKRQNSDIYDATGLYTHPKLDVAGEAAAHRAHRQIDGLSLNNARRLVNCYGAVAVEKGVKTTTIRHNIQNPAGFLVTLLRSELLFYKRSGQKPAPKMKFEDSTTWVKQMAVSPYVKFLANVDEFEIRISE